jgi:uracil-DNA glycosylase
VKAIRSCTKCGLCANQFPLLQASHGAARVMFVGLSAVKSIDAERPEPFSDQTRSGALLRQLVSEVPNHPVYFTNLVKCLPLENGKIRYPYREEMDACISNLLLEFQTVSPERVILLGRQVSDYVGGSLGVRFTKSPDPVGSAVGTYGNVLLMAAYHPSYMLIYRRRQIETYKQSVLAFITSMPQRPNNSMQRTALRAAADAER